MAPSWHPSFAPPAAGPLAGARAFGATSAGEQAPGHRAGGAGGVVRSRSGAGATLIHFSAQLKKRILWDRGAFRVCIWGV